MFRNHQQRWVNSLLLATVLWLVPAVARGQGSFPFSGETGKGQAADAGVGSGAYPTINAGVLGAPMRLDLQRASRWAVTVNTNWCVYRITGYVSETRKCPVEPEQLICMGCLDLFAPCPEQAEFHLLDGRGREICAVYAELVSGACAGCDLGAKSKYMIYRH